MLHGIIHCRLPQLPKDGVVFHPCVSHAKASRSQINSDFAYKRFWEEKKYSNVAAVQGGPEPDQDSVKPVEHTK